MKLVTKSQFAKIVGISSTRVGKIADQLTLVQVEGKVKPQIDLEGVATIEYRKKRELPEPTIQAETPPPKTSPHLPGNNLSGISNATPEEKALKDIKLEEQIEELKIKNQIKRSDLVQKKVAIKVFNKFYSIHENQLKTLGINIGPDISSIYNKSNAIKTEEIAKHLDRSEDKLLKAEINKILNSGEPERINDMNQVFEDATGSILKSIQIEIDKFLKHVEELKKV